MDRVESYSDELRFARKPIGRTMLVLLLVGLAVLPWWAPRAWLARGAVVWLYAIGVVGQNLLIGYTGQLSFGQAGLLAIGAYAFGHLRIAGVPHRDLPNLRERGIVLRWTRWAWDPRAHPALRPAPGRVHLSPLLRDLPRLHRGRLQPGLLLRGSRLRGDPRQRPCRRGDGRQPDALQAPGVRDLVLLHRHPRRAVRAVPRAPRAAGIQHPGDAQLLRGDHSGRPGLDRGLRLRRRLRDPRSGPAGRLPVGSASALRGGHPGRSHFRAARARWSLAEDAAVLPDVAVQVR